MGQIRMAFQLMAIDSSWRTDTVRVIDKGLCNKETDKQRIRNSAGAPPILAKLMKRESWGSEFDRLRYVPYLFMLLFPSGALILYLDLPNEHLLTSENPKYRAAIRLREFQGRHRPIRKLKRRKVPNRLSPQRDHAFADQSIF